MNFFERLQGIFFNPMLTLKGIAEKPRWHDALILVLICVALFSYLTTPYSQKDNLQLMKDNEIKIQEKMGEERYNKMIESLENPSKTGIIIRSFILGPITLLIGFLFSSLIIFGMGRLSSTEGKFMHVFSVFIHANLIDKILGNAVRLVLVLTRKSFIQTTTSLALFFPRLEITSPAFIILSQIDFFQLWLFGILSYGLAFVFKIELKKALFISYGFWLLKSIFYIAIGLLTLRFMG